jgi:hypothetical protein
MNCLKADEWKGMEDGLILHCLANGKEEEEEEGRGLVANKIGRTSRGNGTGRRVLTACLPEAGLPSSAIHPVTPEGLSLTWPFTLYFEAEFEFNWMTIMGRMGWSNKYTFCTIK